MLLLSLFTAFFLMIKWKAADDFKNSPHAIHQIKIKPDTIKINGDSLSFEGVSQKRNYLVYYTLKNKEEKAAFKQCDESLLIYFLGTLSKAEKQRNFSGFDQESYLRYKGIYRVLTIDKITHISSNHHQTVFDLIRLLRRKAIITIQTHFPNPMRNYMTALLFAYFDDDFSEMRSIYQNMGIIHLFALSGLHVSFFVGTIRYLLLRLGLREDIVGNIQIPLSFLYAGLTGFSVSVMRALIQHLLRNYRIKGLTNLSITLILMMIISPFFLLTTGGVLSFFYAFLLESIVISREKGIKEMILEGGMLFLASMPLLLWYFGGFQPFSILLTIIFSFLFEWLILPLVTVSFLLSKWMVFDQFNIIFKWLEGMVSVLNQFFHQPNIIGKPPIIILIMMILCILIAYDCYRLKKWRLAMMLLITFFLLCLFVKIPKQNEITVIDVGQGDSILLRDRHHHTILIDTGGRVSYGEGEQWQKRHYASNASKTLIPYLKSRGVSQIDHLIITHTDADHMGDMVELTKSVKVKAISVSKGSLQNQTFVRLLKETKSRIDIVKIGDNFPIFDGYLTVLSPFGRGDGKNNDSIVTYGKFYGKRFLFTGDLEKEGEEALLEHYPNLTVDVLKVGHHGSQTSSSPNFIKAISPKVALISVGKNNRYRHPNQVTLKTLQKNAVRVYRTDENGAIRLHGWTKWHLETVR